MGPDEEVLGTIRPGVGRAWLASYLDPEGEDEAVEAFSSRDRAEQWLVSLAEASGWKATGFRSELVDSPVVEKRVLYGKVES